MKLTIDITDEMYQAVKNGTWCGNELWYNALKNGIPQETVTEFADRCRECGARYGRLLNQKWIPVCERLPEEKLAVLVWCPEYKNMYCAYLENKNWWIFGAFSQIIPNAVIAWMPLPEPYKAESEDKE